MIEIRGFNGKLNLDDNPYRIPKDDFVDALNVTRDAQGQGQDMTITNLIGNTLVSNSLPSGVNKVIGNYADRTRNRQYYFTWNSEDFHRISYYDASLDTIVVVMENITDTGGENVLNFSPSFRINHIDIVYRDLQGDLLFWTDGKNPPRKINIKTATTGGYGVIQSSFIDVAKEPPSAPPYCAYENDSNVSINNLQNKQFKFKYRFVFDDLEKSVTSAQSEVPIPYDYSNQSIVSDSTKNCLIRLILQTGADNVKKIEILGAESLGETYTDFFLISVIDKQIQGLSNDDVFSYLFYNDQVYNTIPLNESLQPFDNIPQKAFAQSLPNGNVLDYGAITEGYDLVNVQADIINYYIQSDLIKNSLLITAFQNAQPAFGIGNITVTIGGIPNVGSSFTISTTEGDINVSVVLGDTINTLATKVSAAAVLLGFTSISVVNNVAVIYKLDASLIKVSETNLSIPNSIDSSFAYDWSSKYKLGIVYFDEKGRTNGVMPINESVNTIPYEYGISSPYPLLVPKIVLELFSRPPLWAKYFQIVRTKNLSKSNFLYWISSGTYKDEAPNEAGLKYAYISISNLLSYQLTNPKTSLGYEFTVGDRIKFVGLYNSSGAFSQLYVDKDFQIVDSLINPTINGITYKGQFLKIILPQTTSLPAIPFDFGGNTYANYFIQIYTPANNFSNELNIYYEFGEKYTIGDAGSPLAYHQGNAYNQDSTIGSSALFNFYKGDSYFRYRNIPTGGIMRWGMTPKSGISGTYYPMVSTLTLDASNTSEYTPNSVNGTSVLNQITFASPIGLVSRQFTISGSLRVKSTVNSSSSKLQFYWGGLPLTSQYVNLGPLVAGVESVITISFVAPFIPGFTSFGWGLTSFSGDLLDFTIQLIDGNLINQPIIDPNFSDNYDSAASPNGRPWIFNPNARQNYNPVLIRFGGEYQQGTNINNINRFYEENFDVYDRSRGAIRKMFIEGRNQYIFQEFDVGVVTVLTQIVRDTANNPLSAESDRLLNKIIYPYIGQYGIGDVPESFAYGKYAKYFVDSNKGVVCRLSTDGITPLSVTYKMNAFFIAKLAAFKASLNIAIPVLGTPTVYGAFDSYTNKYIIALSAISRPSFSQPAYTLVYTESRGPSEGFETFTSYFPENMGDLNNLLITFKNGQLWKHNSSTYCNFYGVQYDCYVETVFNDNSVDKKSYLAIMQTSNAAWYCPSIKSQLNTYGSTPQQSQIVEARFVLQEGQYNSAILRDMNSPGGIINGQTMHGNYLIVKFKRDAASSLYYINTVSLNYNNSPLNAR